MLLENLNQIPVSRSKTGNEKTFSSNRAHTHSLSLVGTTREDDGRRATCSPRHLLVKDNKTMIKLCPTSQTGGFICCKERGWCLVLLLRQSEPDAGCINGYNDQVSALCRLRLSNFQASVRRESDARLYQTQHRIAITACPPRPSFRSFDYVKWSGIKVF